MVSTHAALFDFLRQTFGIGDYDEMFGQPWHEARIREIGKLKTQMRRRRIDVEDAHQAAIYARDHRLPITEAWQIFDLVDRVRLERAKALRAARFERQRDGLDAALAEAHAAGDHTWVARLLNADPRELPDLINEWRQQCSTPQ